MKKMNSTLLFSRFRKPENFRKLLARKSENGTVEPIQISLDTLPATAKPSSPSLLRSPTSSLPIKELLLLSPSSARRSSALR